MTSCKEALVFPDSLVSSTRPPRILVITSCTGDKAVTHPAGLSQEDFLRGPDHISACHAALADHLTPARDLYVGQQHKRLLRGIRHAEASGHLDVDLRILSAGYGLVQGDDQLAPYECTFSGMRRADLRAHAESVGIPAAIREALATDVDLILVLLGDDYLEACALDEEVQTAAPTVVFCGKRTASRLPDLGGPHGPARVQVLTNAEAKRFSCGLVALKGEIGARILVDLAERDADKIEGYIARLVDPETDVLSLLEREGDGRSARGSATITANPAVDHVIHVPADWKEQSSSRAIKYFIPDWDDRVDPDYDFISDEHAGGRGDYSNEAYAHQLYTHQLDEDPPADPSDPLQAPRLNYDGLLVSRVIIDKSKAKRKLIYEHGVHRHLRVPSETPVLGDCGAFGYVKEKEPPFSTADLLDYYQALDFTYGVSADHLILSPDADDRDFRYELTIANAVDFLREHEKRAYAWTPIGAVQGWSPESYARAAKALANEGYSYLGLGGLVRSQTKAVLQVVEAVRRAVPDVRLHLFGVARLGAIGHLKRMELTSFDSASPLRRAWGNAYGNYWTLGGERYAAVRVPVAGRSHTAIKAVKEGRATYQALTELEGAALDALRQYAAMERPSRQRLLRPSTRSRRTSRWCPRTRRPYGTNTNARSPSGRGRVSVCGLPGRRHRGRSLPWEQPEPPPRLPQHLRVLRAARPPA